VTWSPDRRLGMLLLAAAAGTNVPTPLLLIYGEDLDLTDASLTAIFGVYALGLMLALAVAGQAADRWGRRRVALPAALGSGVASLFFILAQESEGLLYLARFLQGAVSGTVFTVVSAWLVETAALRGRTSGPRTAAVTMTGGFAIGPTVSGLIGEWGPAPLTLPYVLHVAGLAVAIGAVWPVAETVERRSAERAEPRPGAFGPGRVRTALVVIAPLAVCVYAFPASAIGGMPVLLGFPVAEVALTGLLAGATLGAGTLAAPLQARLGTRTAPVAAGCGAVGFGMTSLAAAVPPLLLLAVPAAVVLGAGGGLALASGLARLPLVASPGRLGSVSAAFYATAYVGFGFPLMLASLSLVLPVAVWLVALALVCLALTVQQLLADL
jgi:hypothetical protein